MFFASELRPFSHHRSPAFHHKFTIKKPQSATTFSQKPLQKHHLAIAKKNNSKAEALPSFFRFEVVRYLETDQLLEENTT
jgi:hypothetical protein